LTTKGAGTGGGGGGGGDKPNYWTISGWGLTPYDALANIKTKVSRRIKFAHAQLYLFSERMARTVGVMPILNAVGRSRQSRRIITLGVVKDDKVEEMLTANIPIETSNIQGLNKLINLSLEEMAGTTAEQVRDFFIKLEQPGIDPYVVALELTEADTRKQNTKDAAPYPGMDSPIRIIGKYAFRGGQLAGLLDYRETRGCNWIVGKVKEATLIVKYPGEEGILVDITASEAECKITPYFYEGKPAIKVQIRAEGRINNVTGHSEIKNNLELMESLNRRMAEVIRNDIESAIAKAKKLHSDVFGFGFAFYRTRYDRWKEMEMIWDELFSDLHVEIEVETEITSTGLVNSDPMGY
ncbi:MAG: Ger(x)C family spore germination protein, partial [Halanaerobium sp.]|nr:Ger(x)C family spore germination protein [Halanaerobium sp.]